MSNPTSDNKIVVASENIIGEGLGFMTPEKQTWAVGDDIFFLCDDDTRVLCYKVIKVSGLGITSEQWPRIDPNCSFTIDSPPHPRAFRQYEDAAIHALKKISEKRQELAKNRCDIATQAVAMNLPTETLVKIFGELQAIRLVVSRNISSPETATKIFEEFKYAD